MSAEATCRCICHAFGDERLYCDHRGCCNAWAKGYRDASSDMLTSAHYKAGYEAGRSRAPSPPETPASEGGEMVTCPGRTEPHPRGWLCVDPKPAPPRSDADPKEILP